MPRNTIVIALLLILCDVMSALADFLPLGLGNTWDYGTQSGDGETQTVTGFEIVFGTETVEISYSNSTNNSGLRNFWTTGSNGGVLLWGFERPGLSYVYDPPIAMVDAPLSLGQSWSQDIDIYAFPELEFVSTFRAVFTVTEKQTLSVPAGDFHAFAVELRVPVFPMTTEPTGEISERGTEVLNLDWWSEGVGTVQYGPFDVYRLLSYNSPTPVVSSSWGQLKRVFNPPDTSPPHDAVTITGSPIPLPGKLLRPNPATERKYDN